MVIGAVSWHMRSESNINICWPRLYATAHPTCQCPSIYPALPPSIHALVANWLCQRCLLQPMSLECHLDCNLTYCVCSWQSIVLFLGCVPGLQSVVRCCCLFFFHHGIFWVFALKPFDKVLWVFTCVAISVEKEFFVQHISIVGRRWLYRLLKLSWWWLGRGSWWHVTKVTMWLCR